MWITNCSLGVKHFRKRPWTCEEKFVMYGNEKANEDGAGVDGAMVTAKARSS